MCTLWPYSKCKKKLYKVRNMCVAYIVTAWCNIIKIDFLLLLITHGTKYLCVICLKYNQLNCSFYAITIDGLSCVKMFVFIENYWFAMNSISLHLIDRSFMYLHCVEHYCWKRLWTYVNFRLTIFCKIFLYLTMDSHKIELKISSNRIPLNKI